MNKSENKKRLELDLSKGLIGALGLEVIPDSLRSRVDTEGPPDVEARLIGDTWLGIELTHYLETLSQKELEAQIVNERLADRFIQEFEQVKSEIDELASFDFDISLAFSPETTTRIDLPLSTRTQLIDEILQVSAPLVEGGKPILMGFLPKNAELIHRHVISISYREASLLGSQTNFLISRINLNEDSLVRAIEQKGAADYEEKFRNAKSLLIHSGDFGPSHPSMLMARDAKFVRAATAMKDAGFAGLYLMGSGKVASLQGDGTFTLFSVPGDH